jgi:hypothetical protein
MDVVALFQGDNSTEIAQFNLCYTIIQVSKMALKHQWFHSAGLYGEKGI